LQKNGIVSTAMPQTLNERLPISALCLILQGPLVIAGCYRSIIKVAAIQYTTTQTLRSPHCRMWSNRTVPCAATSAPNVPAPLAHSPQTVAQARHRAAATVEIVSWTLLGLSIENSQFAWREP
jgi:hypothetical protein